MSRLAHSAAVLLLALAGTAGCASATPGRPGATTTASHRVPGEELPLDPSERTRLAHGETIVRENTIDDADHRYVGGITYTMVDASPSQIWALFDDMEAYRRVLPKTKQAKLVGHDGEDRLVELVQGDSIVSAEYTIRVRHDAAAREVRFWLEPSRPHSIDDAWGFFRVSPFVTETGETRLLLTYGVMVDVGPGLLRELFEEKVRAAMLAVPQRVRHYVVGARRVER